MTRHLALCDELRARCKTRLQDEQARLKQCFLETPDPLVLLQTRSRLVDEVPRECWQTLEIPPTLALLATGHACMAIYHQVVQRDATLSRMMPKGWLRDPDNK